MIGVTGHRDLRPEDCAKLEEKVREIFLQLRRDYPATPLILVSALAEGADRLAARVALSPHMGVSLIAPLPMPQDLYELDFESLAILETPMGALAVESSSREEFRALLERAIARPELGLAHGNTRESIAEQGAKRDKQYDLVGKFIAQHSQILIALWDGVESKRVGGTASVVQYQINGVPDADPCVLEDPEGFPVYHVLTPRVKNPYPQGEVLQCRPIYPKAFAGNQERAKKYYAKMFGRLNEYNEYVAGADEVLADDIKQSKKYLLQDVAESELPGGMIATLNRYAVTDALAIRFRRRWLWAQILLHGGTFAGVFWFCAVRAWGGALGLFLDRCLGAVDWHAACRVFIQTMGIGYSACGLPGDRGRTAGEIFLEAGGDRGFGRGPLSGEAEIGAGLDSQWVSRMEDGREGEPGDPADSAEQMRESRVASNRRAIGWDSCANTGLTTSSEYFSRTAERSLKKARVSRLSATFVSGAVRCCWARCFSGRKSAM